MTTAERTTESTEATDLPPIFIKVSRAARLLDLDESYVYKLCQANKIDGVYHFGTAVRIHYPTLVEWARRRVQPARGDE